MAAFISRGLIVLLAVAYFILCSTCSELDGGSLHHDVQLRETGSTLHAFRNYAILFNEQEDDLFYVTLSDLTEAQIGFQFTKSNIMNPRWYLESSGSQNAFPCIATSLFWECHLENGVRQSLKPTDKIFVRGTMKCVPLPFLIHHLSSTITIGIVRANLDKTRSVTIRKDILGLPNDGKCCVQCNASL